MGEETIIQNETRRAIYKHILNYPGVHFTVLQDIFGVSEGTLRYHLRYLERKKQVRSEMEKGRRCYYSSQISTKNDLLNVSKPMELSKVQEQILNSIRSKNGITQKDLSSQTGINRFNLMYNIKKLIGFGIIRKYQNGREVHYEYISRSMLKKEILRRAAIDLLKGRIDESTFEGIIDRIDED